MSMEEFIPVAPQSPADRVVALRNKMQFALADRHQEDFDTFLELRALPFKELVEKDVSILEMFEEDPEAALEQVEKIIYH